MRTTPELLTEILGVLGKINSNIESIKAPSSSAGTKDSGTKYSSPEDAKRAKTVIGGFDVSNFAKNKKDTDRLRDTADAIKILSTSLIPFSKAIISFSMVPERAKKSLIQFLRELLQQANISGAGEASIAAKNVAEAISILSDAIPKLGKSVFQFGMMEKMGFVSSTSNGIKELIKVLMPRRRGTEGFLSVEGAKMAAQAIGIISDALPKLAKGVFTFGMAAKIGLVHLTALGLTELLGVMTTLGAVGNVPLLAASAALASLGLALNGIANVLKSFAVVMLAFSGSILIMVGAIWLAAKAFGVGPIAAMLIIVGAVTILAGGFALLGLVSPLLAGAGIAIKEIGKGLAILGLGIVTFIGTIALANVLTGGFINTFGIMIQGMAMIGMMTLLFAGIGVINLLGGIVTKGAEASQQMGLGLISLAVGILALGGVFALLNKMDVDTNEMFWSTAKGIGMLALTFAGLGLMSIVIIPGILTLFAMTVSLALFGLAMLEMGAVIKKLGGKEGIKESTQNIADMVNIVTAGVLGGLYGGLGKNAGAELDRGDTVQFRRVRKALKILTSIASSLSSFATGLTAFSKAGQITEVTYDEKTGKPIYGKTIFVTGIAESMVTTFNTFVVELVKGTENLKKRQSNALNRLSKALVGKGKNGGLIGGIIEFADALKTYADFGKKGQIFVPEFDANGHPIMVGGKEKKTAVSTTDIVNVIIKTFGDFATKLAAKAPQFAEMGTYGAQMKVFNEALMGKKGFLRSKPGILSGILEFSNVLNSFAQYGKANEIPYMDENGKTIGIPVDQVVNNMMGSIQTFLTTLKNKIGDGKLEGIAKEVKGKLESFTDVIKSFDVLYESQTSLERLSNTMGQLAQNFALLVTNAKELDVNKFQKLVDINAKYANETSFVPAPSSGTTGTSGANEVSSTSRISPEDINAIVAAITNGMKNVQITNSLNGTFEFEFMKENGGNISFNK